MEVNSTKQIVTGSSVLFLNKMDMDCGPIFFLNFLLFTIQDYVTKNIKPCDGIPMMRDIDSRDCLLVE